MTTIPAGALVRDRELPELGPGRIVAELNDGSSRIVFEYEDEMRDVDLQRVDVVRLPLIPGTKVQVRTGGYGDETTEPGEVVDAELPDSADELCDYVVVVDGDEMTVSEAELFPEAPASTAPLDRFDALYWRGPFRFFARWGMHRTVARVYEDAEGLPSLIGARIEPHPGQLRAARQVLWAEDPNYVLADASRRDRLVEAGLVAQAMTAEDPDNRVLVVAPGLRTREWKTQLELRFGGREYVRITEARAAGFEFHELAQLFQQDRMVVSTGLIEHNRDARTMLAGEGWDVAIVAGAHRFEPDGVVADFVRDLARLSETTLALSPMPRDPDPADLSGLLSLVRPDEYGANATEDFEAYVDDREPIWERMRRSLDVVRNEPDEDEIADLAGDWEEVADRDDYFEKSLEAIEAGDADTLERLLGYVQSYYGFADRAVRTPREALEQAGAEWPDRRLVRLDYEPDESEAELANALAAVPIPEEPDLSQMVLAALYHRRFWQTPERFLDLLHDRAEVLEQGSGPSGDGPDLLARLARGPDPSEAESIWSRAVEQAPPLPDETEWIGGLLSTVQEWERTVGRGPGRYEAAADWIEEHLDVEEPVDEDELDEEEEDDEDQPPEPAVVVVSASQRSAEAFHSELGRRLGEEAVELYHAELPDALLDDAMSRFQHDEDCDVLVVDELAGQGRRLARASAVVHLDPAWSPGEIDSRIERIERADAERDVVSVVPVGPDPVERELQRLYHEVLDVYEGRPGPESWDFPAVQRELLEAVGTEGPEGVASVCDAWRERVDAAGKVASVAFRASIDPRPSQLEDVVGFADLLDFVDGIDDPLPVRHWARMIGIDDHRVRPGVYDFKWHWSSVRRDLAGFDIPEGDDPEEWADEETVRYLSGTFGRRHAVDDESLEFFGPGHQLVDALVDDALAPTDGRTTVFARRLDGDYRGKVFAVAVVDCKLNDDYWDDEEAPPKGLIRRVHRHFWPETSTAMVELDLRGDGEPSVIDDPDLERRLEDNYEGPEADQKIEYEMFVRAIEDAARFRSRLRDALDTGLEDLREEREWLVDDAVDRLEEDFEQDLAYWRGVAGEADDERQREAKQQVEWREQLLESVRDYAMEIDALALVVGGTPEALL